MKNIFLFAFFSVFVLSFVFAAQAGISGGNLDASVGVQNQGEDSTIELRENSDLNGSFGDDKGKMLVLGENGVKLRVKNIEVHSTLNFSEEKVQNRSRLMVNLSNGRNAEIKVMPETASLRAIERLGLKVCNESNNCTIELKEVGEGNQTRAAYSVQAQKESKILGLFKSKMDVSLEIDADTEEVLDTKKPWWAFIASE